MNDLLLLKLFTNYITVLYSVKHLLFYRICAPEKCGNMSHMLPHAPRGQEYDKIVSVMVIMSFITLYN